MRKACGMGVWRHDTGRQQHASRRSGRQARRARTTPQAVMRGRKTSNREGAAHMDITPDAPGAACDRAAGTRDATRSKAKHIHAVLKADAAHAPGGMPCCCSCTRAPSALPNTPKANNTASWPLVFLDSCSALAPCAAHCRRAGLLVSHSRYPDVAYQARPKATNRLLPPE